MKISLITLAALLCSISATYSQQINASQILERSIKYHDPEGKWIDFKGTLALIEEREAGDRHTRFSIDNTSGKFVFERDDTAHGVLLDSCFVISGEAECERIKTIRNYYLYLWGLPMKLKDKDTPLQEKYQTIEDWNGQKVYAIDVNYEKENWTFFIDTNNYALLGYQFYFNTKDGGELITLKDEYEFGGIKFPRERTWYSLPDSSYLAKDKLDIVK